ncbi:MAG: bifunctional oligoribonuclease/PAP phosphatase NrnA [Corynebacterium sp.]|nr:bifunctional oligoribonuclease/PAP phosphatase NrnA [Corynebacterium sp.]
MNKLTGLPSCDIATYRWSEITREFLAAKNVCVIGHVNPDADAIGSVCATVAAARQLGKQAQGIIGSTDPIEEGLLTIPGADQVRGVEVLPPADLYIVLDCGASSRTGALQGQLLNEAEKVIVIDHHASNRGFGHWNVIDAHAESTTTMLVPWFQQLGVELTRDVAYCLYAGLATDTGSFKWGRPQMHSMAQQLLETGLEVRDLSTELFDGGNLADLKMLGRVISELRAYDVQSSGASAREVTTQQFQIPTQAAASKTKSVVFAVASYERITGHDHGAVERIADVIRSLRGIDLAVVLKEYSHGEWTISLRSHTENVAQIATAFGGGGHLRSAGFSVFGSEDFVIAEILKVVVDQFDAPE